MKWFLVHMCDEDTVNTSMTYKDLVFAKDEEEAKKSACAKWLDGFICIGVRVATDDEVAHMSH